MHGITRRALLAVTACAGASGGCATRPPRRPPNVLLIVLDDMGFSDLGVYGSEIRTPNIDALAGRGLSFQTFYVYPRCSPTRAAMLTGRAPHEVGVGFLTTPADAPAPSGPYQGYLRACTPTLASLLKSDGYGTYMAGKWHLGEGAAHWPRHYGFDRYFGLISGASSYFGLRQQPGAMPRIMALDDEPWAPSAPDFYMTDAFTDAARGFVREHFNSQPTRPFFCYLAYTAPHWPLHAPEDDIRAYDGVYAEGWNAVRAARVQRLRERGIDLGVSVPQRAPASVGDWEAFSDKQEWQRKMQTHAAMITRADRGIGAVIEELRRMGQLDNTLIILSSDNGASAENVEDRGLNDPTAAIGTQDSYVAYGPRGAFVGNAPLRDFKGTTYEGRSPLIVSGAGVNARDRIDRDSVVGVADILPTVLEFAGLPAPAIGEGRSFASVLSHGAAMPERPLFCEHLGWRSVRRGTWKLVMPRGGAWELYNLVDDPGEQRNVASEHADVVLDLSGQWEAWSARVGARPITSEELLLQTPGRHNH